MNKSQKLLWTLLAVSLLAGCQKTPETIYYSNDAIHNVTLLKHVIGEKAKSDTITGYQVGGADLGFPLYDEKTGKSLTFFGDTFLSPSQSGNWRSNTIAVSTDKNYDDGYDIDSFIHNDKGVAIPAIEGHHVNRYEMTKIPTGAIAIDGVYYLFYFSKYSWDSAVGDANSMNYGGAVKSTDGGQNWERVYDLTWVNHAVDDPAIPLRAKVEDIQTLIDEDASLQKNQGNVNLAHHEGYRFTEIFPLDGKDGYIYCFGMGGYRSGYTSLARVKKENFEVFDDYEYLTSYGTDNAPVWTTGREGLDLLAKTDEGYCLNVTSSEMSISYNKYLKKWLLLMTSNWNGFGAYYFQASNIWGPYTRKGQIIIPASSDILEQKSLYAPLTCEHWQKDDGKTFYLYLSCWKPIYCPYFLKVELA